MKKFTFITLFALGFCCLWFLFSCDKKICNARVQDESFTFRLVDKYGVNQIAKWGARYLSDSVYVTKIDVKYRFNIRADVICYESLQVMYNDSLYHDGQYEYFMFFTKN